MKTLDVCDWTQSLHKDELYWNHRLDHATGLVDSPAFERLSLEVFADLYGLDTDEVDGPAWIREIREAAKALPQWKDMKRAAGGDPWACGNGAAQILWRFYEIAKDALKQEEKAAKHKQAAQNGGTKAAQEKAQEAQEAAGEAISKAIQEAQESGALESGMGEALGEEAETTEMVREGYAPGAGSDAPNLGDSRERRQLSEALRNSNRLRAAFNLAGSMFQSFRSRNGKARQPGVMVDVETGNDLRNWFQPELAQLADPDLELIQLRKYQERSALQWKTEADSPSERGPVVVLVDISSSMNHGSSVTRITWAIALAMALVKMARVQKRKIRVCTYNGGIQHDVDPIKEPAKMAELAMVHPYGGTRLVKAIRQTESHFKGAFKKADYVVITDGEDGLDSLTLPRLKAKGIGVHVLHITQRGNTHPWENFDHHWTRTVVDPSKSHDQTDDAFLAI